MLASKEVAIELGEAQVLNNDSQVSIAYGTFGEKVTNQDLRNKFNIQDSESEEESLEGTGIVARYRTQNNWNFKEHSHLIAKEMIEVGTTFAEKAMAANGWRKGEVDALWVANSTPPDKDRRWAKEIARNLGIDEKSVQSRYLACDGVGAALLDSLRIEGAKNPDTRIVLLGIERLGDLARPVPTEQTIFSNGAAAMAYTPRDIKVINGKTVIMEDPFGVIRSPIPCEPFESKEKLPWWYEVPEGGNKDFSYSLEQASIVLKSPDEEGDDPNFMKMYNLQAAKYFIRKVAPVVLEVLEEYYQNHADNGIIDLGAFHPASRKVLSASGERVNSGLLKRGLPILDIPWVLDKIGIGNASSVTILPVIAQLIKEGKIHRGKVLNVTTYGAGAAFTSANLRFAD